jgi:transcriptional regulator with XRE-family HTH domain
MPTAPAVNVGANVRAELARRGLAQGKLSPVLGISQVQVGARLRGEVSFRIDELQLVADFLEVPLASLVGPDATAASA